MKEFGPQHHPSHPSSRDLGYELDSSARLFTTNNLHQHMACCPQPKLPLATPNTHTQDEV